MLLAYVGRLSTDVRMQGHVCDACEHTHRQPNVSIHTIYGAGPNSHRAKSVWRWVGVCPMHPRNPSRPSRQSRQHNTANLSDSDESRRANFARSRLNVFARIEPRTIWLCIVEACVCVWVLCSAKPDDVRGE